MTEGMPTFCIPIEPPPVGGGGFRFLRNFEAYLDRKGIRRSRRASHGADVLFVNAWHVPIRTVLIAGAANPRVTVVHRVDGAAADYGRDPAVDRAQSRINRLADLTIFQSNYCRFSTRVKYPVIGQDGPVIHNPVDVAAFTPEGQRAELPSSPGPRVCAVTWSMNPRKGAASLYRLARNLPQVQFVLCGRYDDAPDLPNIVRTGVLDTARLASFLRAGDVLATFSENEACPNVVLEALAAGLPVLYKDSGATRELVGECGEAVEEASFRDALARVMPHRSELSRCARERALQLFAPDRVFDLYLARITGSLRSAPGHRYQRLADLAARAVGLRR